MRCPLPRVLIIDDQPDIRTMVSIVLRVNHFDVVEAASAAAGLKEFEASKFDLAIVDIFLQGTNGFEVIMKMRERIPDFPIVAISGMTMLDFVNETPELSNVVVSKSRFVPPILFLRSKWQLERFRAKWIPVRVKETRQNKRLEPSSDSIRIDQAPGAGHSAPEASRSSQGSLPDPALPDQQQGQKPRFHPLRRFAGIFPPSNMQNAPGNRGVAYRG